MASVTFGSVGDIITVCKIITTTIKALSASRGSDVGYRELINELWSLAQALESIKSLLEEDSQIKHKGRLRIALQNCRECLEHELESIRKFSISLGKLGSARSARDAFWKIRWLGHKNDLSTFQQAISSHTSSIALLLQASGIQLSRNYHSEVSTELNELGKRLREDFDNVQQSQKRQCSGIKDSVAGLECALVARNQALESEIRTSRVDTLGKIGQSHDVLLRIDDSSQQCLQALKAYLGINSQTDRSTLPGLNGLLCKLKALLHSSIPDHLQKAPLIYEDALLRKFSIDLEFVPSYDLFLQVVGSHYKGTEGETKIEKGEYAFEDKSQKALCLAGVWTSDILSGKSVFMRVTFDDVTSPQNQCPSCKAITEDTTSQTEIVCQNCKLQYLKSSARPTNRSAGSEANFPPSNMISSGPMGGDTSEITRSVSAIGFFRRVQVLTGKCSYLCYFPDCYICSNKSESLKRHSKLQNQTSTPHAEPPISHHLHEANRLMDLEHAMRIRDFWRNRNDRGSIKMNDHPQPSPPESSTQKREPPPTGDRDTHVPTPPPEPVGRQDKKAKRRTRWDNPAFIQSSIVKKKSSTVQPSRSDPVPTSFQGNFLGSETPNSKHWIFGEPLTIPSDGVNEAYTVPGVRVAQWARLPPEQAGVPMTPPFEQSSKNGISSHLL